MTDDAKKARRLRRATMAVDAYGATGNPKKAAAALGIGESTLRKWVNEYVKLHGLESPAQAIWHRAMTQSLPRGAGATE